MPKGPIAKTLRLVNLNCRHTFLGELAIPYNFAVVDAGGGRVAHVRMDGAWLGSVDIAVAKAWTARAFDMPTEKLGKMAQSGKPLFGSDSTNHEKVVIFGGRALGIDLPSVNISPRVPQFARKR